jgi:hypothetical protein
MALCLLSAAKLQQEPERVPVAFHRSNTRPLLPIKVIDEECLEQRAYWRLAGSRNGLHCSTPCVYWQKASAAVLNNSGVAVKYQ